jgi:alpha-L-fucosidase
VSPLVEVDSRGGNPLFSLGPKANILPEIQLRALNYLVEWTHISSGAIQGSEVATDLNSNQTRGADRTPGCASPKREIA